MDDRLAVYIGAHPDDIDVGMSGSLFKFDLGKHPIMWVVVTDGGADADEYNFDSVHFDPGSLEPWVKKDDLKHQLTWQSPDGKEITRSNYSEDLIRKRCGIEFDDGRWKPKMARHTSSFGDEFDWRTRVTNCVGRDVELRQLSYPDSYDPSIQILYPDAALISREEIFIKSIAGRLAEEIYNFVVSKGYSKDLIYLNSHAPEEVCSNSGENDDHRIVGNAVREAIDILLKKGIKEIYAAWFTIYKPIEPKPGYSKIDANISRFRSYKIKLCKECWETEFIAQPLKGYYFGAWGERKWKKRRYPNNPIDFEYYIAMLFENN